MFIYVSGPYSAPAKLSRAERRTVVRANVEQANRVAQTLVERGHAPFVPHTMFAGWEDERGVDRDRLMALCCDWVERCDALYVIARSKGSDLERARAEAAGLPIFTALDEIPPAGPDATPPSRVTRILAERTRA